MPRRLPGNRQVWSVGLQSRTPKRRPFGRPFAMVVVGQGPVRRGEKEGAKGGGPWAGGRTSLPFAPSPAPGAGDGRAPEQVRGRGDPRGVPGGDGEAPEPGLRRGC